MRGFEVVQQLPFDERRLRQALAALDCGSLEILARGVDVDPVAIARGRQAENEAVIRSANCVAILMGLPH